MKIQLAPWNNEYDAMARTWKSPYEAATKLDDTEQAGSFLKQYLTSLGHDVTVTLDLPPHNERYNLKNNLDLFWGVGAGNPVSRGLGETVDRRALGVETKYPVCWLGPSIITSHPFSAFYRAYARDLTGDMVSLVSGLNPEPVALDDRDQRNNVIRILADRILEWRFELNTPVARSSAVNHDNNFDYDIFLCFNSVERSQVESLYKTLQKHGIRVFLDSIEVKPGQRHQQQIGNALKNSKSIGICYGASGIGPWQSFEVEEAIAEHNARQLPVIPILLKGCSEKPNLPFALGSFSWIDMRDSDQSARLIEVVME